MFAALSKVMILVVKSKVNSGKPRFMRVVFPGAGVKKPGTA
jgi:hypothetical protein